MQQQQVTMKNKPLNIGAKYSNPKVLYNASGKAYTPKNIGVGWGGEKPTPKKMPMKSPMKKVAPKVTPKKKSLPSKTRVMSSLKKTMGY